MASLLTLANGPFSKDVELFTIAHACFTCGWTVKTHPSASLVLIQNAPITSFFPLLYQLWTVKIGGMAPTVFIPDQASFDAFIPPPGYEKHLVGSYDPMQAFNDALGMALPVGGIWSPSLLGELDPTSVRRFLVGWVNSGNSYSADFYELQNLPESIWNVDFTFGAALQVNFAVPNGGGYACQSVPLKADISDTNSNFYSLFFTTGIWNVEAGFAGLGFYAAKENSSGIHAFYEQSADATVIQGFVTGLQFDLSVTPNSLFICKTPGVVGNAIDIYSMSTLPIGNHTSASFVCIADPGTGFRYNLRNPTGFWLDVDGVTTYSFGILIPYMFSSQTAPNAITWEANGGAIQNLEAFVHYIIGPQGSNNYNLLGLAKDLILGHGVYGSGSTFDHDGRTWYTFTLNHPQVSMLVPVE